MPDEERLYYYDRAEAEIKAAQEAAHPQAVNAHYVLAGYYLDLTYNPASGSAPAETNEVAEGAPRADATDHFARG